MVSRHLTLDFQMVCLTDDSTGIDPAIQCYPIPEMDLPAGPERGWKKLTTFKPELYDLKGVALFLDIDIVSLDALNILLAFLNCYISLLLLFSLHI